MPVRTILKWPDSRLTHVSEEVDASSPHTRQIAQDLRDTMISALGVGLAASQVGLNDSICVICSKTYHSDKLKADPVLNDVIVLVNPKVTPIGDKTFVWKEACLSVEDFTEKVRRYNTVGVEYSNLLGDKIKVEVSGELAGVIQHETDHLVGKTFLERLSSEKRRNAKNVILSRKRRKAQALKKQIKKEKREAAIEKAQSNPPKPGFRVAASNKSKIQQKNKRNRKK